MTRETTSTLLAVLVIGMAVGHGICDVKVWELPEGSDTGKIERDSWKEAAAGSAPKGGVAAGNDRFTVVLAAGAKSPVLVGNLRDTRVEFALSAAPVKSAEIVSADPDVAEVRFAQGDAQGTLRIEKGRPFVSVTSGPGAADIKLGATGRFMLMPDFFAHDIVFDAVRMEQDNVQALADNFFVNLIEGGTAMVVCVWQNFTMDNKDEREESVVMLNVEGEGANRKFTGSTTPFPGQGKPVYVGLMEGDGLWHGVSVADWPANKPGRLDWKPPFDARWRADFIAKPGKRSRDYQASVISFYFPGPPKSSKDEGVETIRTKRHAKLRYFDEYMKQMVTVWEAPKYLAGKIDIGSDMHGRPCDYPCYWQGGAPHFILYTDRNPYPKKGRSGENIHDVAVVYPADRSAKTPLSEFTVTDIIRDTLGKGPCQYVLDMGGVKSRHFGGETAMHFEGATCGVWESHAKPLLDEWKAAGGKLDDEKRQKLVWMCQDMAKFVAAVNERLHEYDAFLKDVRDICAKAKDKSPEVGPFVDTVSEYLDRLQKQVLDKLPGYDNGAAGWQKRAGELAKLAEGEFDGKVYQIGDIRSLANDQDISVATARHCAKMIRQEAALALGKTGSAEAAELAKTIRGKCRDIMQSPHPMEGI